jgi:hypothetical protein
MRYLSLFFNKETYFQRLNKNDLDPNKGYNLLILFQQLSFNVKNLIYYLIFYLRIIPTYHKSKGLI